MRYILFVLLFSSVYLKGQNENKLHITTGYTKSIVLLAYDNAPYTFSNGFSLGIKNNKAYYFKISSEYFHVSKMDSIFHRDIYEWEHFIEAHYYKIHSMDFGYTIFNQKKLNFSPYVGLSFINKLNNIKNTGTTYYLYPAFEPREKRLGSKLGIKANISLTDRLSIFSAYQYTYAIGMGEELKNIMLGIEYKIW